MNLTWVMSLFGLANLVLSTFALVVAFRSSAMSLSRRLSQHSTRLDELATQQEELALAMKTLRARVGMQNLRAQRKDAADGAQPGNGSATDTATRSARDESADDRWQRETNIALALGRAIPKRS